MNASITRALLVEFTNSTQFPGRISKDFPFLSGYFTRRDVPVRWLRFGLSTTHLFEHGRDEITLSADEEARLLEVARVHAPSHILFTDQLSEAHETKLRAVTTGVRFLILDEWNTIVGNHPGLEDFRAFGEMNDPEFMPAYDWEPGNDEEDLGEMDNIYLRLGRLCGHLQPTNRSGPYADLDDVRVRERVGCTFCGCRRPGEAISGDDACSTGREDASSSFGIAPASRDGSLVGKNWDWLNRPTPPDWVTRQIEAIAHSRGSAERFPNFLLLENLESPGLLTTCLDAMRETGMAAHTALLIACRTDRAPQLDRILRARFESSPDTTERIGVHASGIESFDSWDLQLFNKGTTTLDGLRAINIYRALATDYPGRFWSTGISYLLFTPWTTAESLHLNVGLIRFLAAETGNMFQARLRLHPWLPITALAEHDGLLVEEELDPTQTMNRRKLFGIEKPWRFRDGRIRPLCRIVLRFELCEAPNRDTLTEELKKRLTAAYAERAHSDDNIRLDYMMCLIDVVRSTHDVLEETVLMDLALDLWRSRRGADLSAPDAPRYRFGEEHLTFPALLARMVPLVTSNLKPLLSVEDVSLGELTPPLVADLERQGVVGHLVERSGAGARGPSLLVARDRPTAERGALLLQRLDGTMDPPGRAEAPGDHRQRARPVESILRQTRLCPGLQHDQQSPGLGCDRRRSGAGRSQRFAGKDQSGPRSTAQQRIHGPDRP